jgi:hypothetical protein
MSYRQMKAQQAAAKREGSLVHRGSRFHGTMKGVGTDFSEPLEKHLSNEVSFIVLDVVEAFMTGFKNELLVQSTESSSGSFLDKIFNLLMQLLQSNQTRSFYSHLYATLRYGLTT